MQYLKTTSTAKGLAFAAALLAIVAALMCTSVQTAFANPLAPGSGSALNSKSYTVKYGEVKEITFTYDSQIGVAYKDEFGYAYVTSSNKKIQVSYDGETWGTKASSDMQTVSGTRVLTFYVRTKDATAEGTLTATAKNWSADGSKYTQEVTLGKANVECEKGDNPLTVTAKNTGIYNCLKVGTLAKKTTIATSKVLKVNGAKGTVTYAKQSGNAKILVNSSNGKVTLKKGLVGGKVYKVKVAVTAAGNDNYNAKTVTKTYKIQVGKKNPITVTGKVAKVHGLTNGKLSKTKSLSRVKVLNVQNAKGYDTYTKVNNAGGNKITVNSKNGRITVKKGLKKGTYTVKVKVSSTGWKKWGPGSVTAKVKIKVVK